MPPPALALLNRPALRSPGGTPGPGFTLVDPEAAHLGVLDLGVTRGDGIFETISVGHGRPQALEAHLSRFARSAELMDLPEPDLDAWRAAVDAVIAELGAVPEAAVKAVMTRGVEGGGAPTGWVYGAASPDFSSQRSHGIRVVTLDRGYRHDVPQTSPWLLAGAKTLSYAVNRAALREAARRGADDVIFVSSDGYVLEGPTSTVLLRRGERLLTPGTGLAILDGTTQGSIFRFAEHRGLGTGFALLRPHELHEADALWLVSSVRHAAPVRELDGRALVVDAALSEAMNDYLATRTD